MQVARLQAESREARGTRAARRLRRQGKLPGVIYGHGETPETIAVSAHELRTLIEHGSHVIEIDLDGTTRQVLIKDVQVDRLLDAPVHVDFARIDLNERVSVSVPLDFRGTPVGTHEGGLLDHNLLDVQVECVATEIPASIRVNVADMNLGDILHVKDLELPPGVAMGMPGDTIVCSVRLKAAAAAAAEVPAVEAEAAQPEIIGRKEKEKAEPAE